MIDAVSLTLIIAGLIIIIGFLTNNLFKQTGFPDILILITIGLIFGSLLGISNSETFSSFTPYISALALACILFDGGMGLNIKQVLNNSPRALLLAVLGFVLSVLCTCVFMIYVFKMDFLYGLLFGSIFGGSSSIAAISLANKIKMSQNSSITLILESALTDVFCIVISLALIEVIITGQADVGAIGLDIAGKFLIGAGIGILLGFAWLFTLKKQVAALSFSYMLTLGVVILGYAVSEVLGGSGALSVLLFGLILGNEREIMKALRRHSNIDQSDLAVSKGMKRFDSEIAFLIRTFFFVFLGVMVSTPTIYAIIAGVTLSVMFVLIRYAAVYLTTVKSSLRKEQNTMTIVLTRDLATAALATLPAQFGLYYSDLFIGTAVVVIILTAVFSTIGSIVVSRKAGKMSISS